MAIGSLCLFGLSPAMPPAPSLLAPHPMSRGAQWAWLARGRTGCWKQVFRSLKQSHSQHPIRRRESRFRAAQRMETRATYQPTPNHPRSSPGAHSLTGPPQDRRTGLLGRVDATPGQPRRTGKGQHRAPARRRVHRCPSGFVLFYGARGGRPSGCALLYTGFSGLGVRVSLFFFLRAPTPRFLRDK